MCEGESTSGGSDSDLAQSRQRIRRAKDIISTPRPVQRSTAANTLPWTMGSVSPPVGPPTDLARHRQQRRLGCGVGRAWRVLKAAAERRVWRCDDAEREGCHGLHGRA